MTRLEAIALFALLTTGGCDRAPPEPAGASARVTPTPSAAGAVTPTPATANPCTTMCRYPLEIHCAAADGCVAECEHAWDIDVCRDTMRRSLSCFAAQGKDAWACDEDGLPAVKEGHCDAEQAAHAECMGAQP
jgi:hypothetical protein